MYSLRRQCIKKFLLVRIPEIKNMIMCLADNEIRRSVIHSHLSNRFSYGSSILQIECVGVHPLHIAFLTKNLQVIDVCSGEARQKNKKQNGPLSNDKTMLDNTNVRMDKCSHQKHFLVWNDVNIINFNVNWIIYQRTSGCRKLVFQISGFLLNKLKQKDEQFRSEIQSQDQEKLQTTHIYSYTKGWKTMFNNMSELKHINRNYVETCWLHGASNVLQASNYIQLGKR